MMLIVIKSNNYFILSVDYTHNLLLDYLMHIWYWIRYLIWCFNVILFWRSDIIIIPKITKTCVIFLHLKDFLMSLVVLYEYIVYDTFN